jgi:hypothetical protein
MELFADPDALTSRVSTGTYTVSPDPDSINPNPVSVSGSELKCNSNDEFDSMNPDQKHSYRYVPIC